MGHPRGSLPSPLCLVSPKCTAAFGQVCLAGVVTPFSLFSEVTLQVRAGSVPPARPHLLHSSQMIRQGLGLGPRGRVRGSPSGSRPAAWRGEGQRLCPLSRPLSWSAQTQSSACGPSPESHLCPCAVPSAPAVGGMLERLQSGVLASAASGEPAQRHPGS